MSACKFPCVEVWVRPCTFSSTLKGAHSMPCSGIASAVVCRRTCPFPITKTIMWYVIWSRKPWVWTAEFLPLHRTVQSWSPVCLGLHSSWARQHDFRPERECQWHGWQEYPHSASGYSQSLAHLLLFRHRQKLKNIAGPAHCLNLTKSTTPQFCKMFSVF